MSPIVHLRTLTKALAATAVFAMTGPSAVAQTERWYDVEIIVFADRTKQYAETEVWPEVAPPLNLGNAAGLAPATGGRTRFQTLSGAELRLHWAYQKLKAASRYEPLLHTGWRQPAMPRKSAIPVHVALPRGNGPASSGGIPPFELDGTVALKVGRYLHLDTDIRYVIPGAGDVRNAPMPHLPVGAADLRGLDGAPAGGADEQAARQAVYRLEESRRVRSGELHYFDHPMFGVVALITPSQPRK